MLIAENKETVKVPAVDIAIRHTYDYARFKLIGVNRNTDKPHVRNISEAIQVRNLLHLFPLIINNDWEVLDGQHRLSAVQLIEASKMLKLPVYYIQDPGITHDDMRLLNSNKINWGNMDYVNYFAGKGRQSFVRLVDFMKRHPKIAMTTCIYLTSSKRANLKELKEGQLVIDTIDLGDTVLKFVYDLKKKMDDSQNHNWKSRDFILAMKSIVNTGKYDHSIMMKSTRNSVDMWHRQINVRSWMFEFTQTYNHNLTDKQKVDFLMLTRHV